MPYGNMHNGSATNGNGPNGHTPNGSAHNGNTSLTFYLHASSAPKLTIPLSIKS
ncbi:hypothetical protein ABVK25_001890 [Lepraria finkii]|uniref:Uncharacterized protein n=1 Tax=Lepraria finkii TaxID=1340010 RepID=A0ABR4BI54_9LECA